MVSRRSQPLLRRVPAWLSILMALMAASVIAVNVQATTGSSDADGTEHHPKTVRLMTGRAVAFALTFDQIVSHSGSQLTLVTPTGGTRRIPIRLVAQPNTLYASIGGLEPGGYRLQWEALTADGTRLRGSLPFNVGQDALGHQF